jgi:hypothetical protein
MKERGTTTHVGLFVLVVLFPEFPEFPKRESVEGSFSKAMENNEDKRRTIPTPWTKIPRVNIFNTNDKMTTNHILACTDNFQNNTKRE